MCGLRRYTGIIEAYGLYDLLFLPDIKYACLAMKNPSSSESKPWFVFRDTLTRSFLQYILTNRFRVTIGWLRERLSIIRNSLV